MKTNRKSTTNSRRRENKEDSDLVGSRGEEEPGVLLLLLPLPGRPLPWLQAQSFTLHPQTELGPLTAGRFVASFLKYFQVGLNISQKVNNDTLIV